MISCSRPAAGAWYGPVRAVFATREAEAFAVSFRRYAAVQRSLLRSPSSTLQLVTEYARRFSISHAAYLEGSHYFRSGSPHRDFVQYFTDALVWFGEQANLPPSRRVGLAARREIERDVFTKLRAYYELLHGEYTQLSPPEDTRRHALICVLVPQPAGR